MKKDYSFLKVTNNSVEDVKPNENVTEESKKVEAHEEPVETIEEPAVEAKDEPVAGVKDDTVVETKEETKIEIKEESVVESKDEAVDKTEEEPVVEIEEESEIKNEPPVTNNETKVKQEKAKSPEPKEPCNSQTEVIMRFKGLEMICIYGEREEKKTVI